HLGENLTLQLTPLEDLLGLPRVAPLQDASPQFTHFSDPLDSSIIHAEFLILRPGEHLLQLRGELDPVRPQGLDAPEIRGRVQHPHEAGDCRIDVSRGDWYLQIRGTWPRE